jgi:hypothetical protein
MDMNLDLGISTNKLKMERHEFWIWFSFINTRFIFTTFGSLFNWSEILIKFELLQLFHSWYSPRMKLFSDFPRVRFCRMSCFFQYLGMFSPYLGIKSVLKPRNLKITDIILSFIRFIFTQKYFLFSGLGLFCVL